MALETNLIANYRMEGNSNDNSGGGYNGTDTSITYGTSYGKLDQGALFNGSSSLISLSSAMSGLTGDLTINAWVNFSSLPANGAFKGIVSRLYGSPSWAFTFELGRDDGRGTAPYYVCRVYVSSTGSNIEDHYVGYPAPSTGTWYMCTFVWTAASHKLELYWNGVSQGTDTTGTLTSFYNNSKNVFIGATNSTGSGSNFFPGDLDEVSMWSRALSSSEVTQLYNNRVNDLNSTLLISDSSLVAYWKLEDVNDSKNSYTLTNNNSVSFSAGKFNNGADFGSTNTTKYLSIASNLGLSSNTFTISAWAKMTGTPTSGNGFTVARVHFSGTNYYMWYYNNAGKMQIAAVRNNGLTQQDTTYTDITLGEIWHHITMTCDGTYIKLYIDGIQIGSTGSISTVNNGGTDLFELGYSSAIANSYLSGLVDDVAVFSKALSETEINYIYGKGRGMYFNGTSFVPYGATSGFFMFI